MNRLALVRKKRGSCPEEANLRRRRKKPAADTVILRSNTYLCENSTRNVETCRNIHAKYGNEADAGRGDWHTGTLKTNVMKELPYNMLPLAAETEMARDWTLLSEKYWKFRKNSATLCQNAKEFPTSRQMKFISPRTGLEWHMVNTYPERDSNSSFYLFYTPYTIPQGKKGCYTISEEDCERITPHFLDRVRTRFLHPRGIFPKTLDETIEAFCRHLSNAGNFLFISPKTHEKYIVLKHGIAIVDVAGNGMNTYITFVTFEMLLHYQTPYKRIVERFLELYKENHNRWDMDRFTKIINQEGLWPGDDELSEIKTKALRKFTPPPGGISRLQGIQNRRYDRAMHEIGESAARQWTPTLQRPGTTEWIAPDELQKGVEELMKQRRRTD